jgi:dTDP-glucose 4,6-dehydratase
MKYYLFGGSGFVGRYLADALCRQGCEVFVCDIREYATDKQDAPHKVSYIKTDIRDREQISALPIVCEDIVVNLAANQYHTKVPRKMKEYFFSVNTQGTENILQVIFEKGCRNFLMFTTDMTYGKPRYLPVDTKHPQHPFGPYGESKKAAEEICFAYREKGMNITILRPRMIMGPGRLGILTKLFKLIDWNLPVPTIGNGKNHYQMISVFDCVSAALCAIDKGLPNKEYNLGSKNPPDIRTLLKGVIRAAHSQSFVLPTCGKMVKWLLNIFCAIGLPVMYKEQFMIADEEYILDISETENELGWQPLHNDADMIKSAYQMYKNNKNS